MKSRRRLSLVALILIGFSIVIYAQDFSLKGRSEIEFNLGLWGGAKVANTITTTSIRSEAKTSGLAGNLLYAYWLREHFSVTLSVGFLAGEASSTVSTSGLNQHASSVVPVLIGMRFYLADPIPEDAVRPFLSAAVGPYIGSEATNTALSHEAHSESSIGGRVGAGIDFLLSRNFKLGASAGYNAMSGFETPVGARKNYSGGDFSLGVAYVF